MTQLRIVPIRAFSYRRPSFLVPNRTADFRYLVDDRWFRDSTMTMPVPTPTWYQLFKWRWGLTDHIVPRARIWWWS